jgi:potassium efflux system protein
VTLLSVLIAVGVLFLAATATRNLSWLQEILILARSSADRGVRFAITTLSRYTIVVVAVVIVAQSLGISWGKVQWLVAAISVGLGFGLQEIFANFVSGVVLLIERPIRVGDVVTVAGVNGWVSKIQMRATTVLDFDRRELVVPNREFVTGQLINWTLTDPKTRVQIPVGVAYGSDTAKATELLLRAANENATVLEDPPPRAIFHEFGESSLNFQLFVYLPHRDVYLETIHELHSAIDAAFREAGITIAFPQRDLHVDAAGPLDVRIVTGKDAGKSAPFLERTTADPPAPGGASGES